MLFLLRAKWAKFPDPKAGDLERLFLLRGEDLGDLDLGDRDLGDCDLDLEGDFLLPPGFLAARFRFITFRTSYLGSSLC